MPEDKMSRAQQRINEAQQLPPEYTKEAIFEKDPLKHYVRKEGWLKPIKEYVQEMRGLGITRPIKYVTLPGRQAIDIGVMWKAGLIHRENGKWANVAICDHKYAADVVNNIGEFGASTEQWLHVELGRSESELKNFFPVDVVNLDSWGSILQEGKDEAKIQQTLETVRQIIHLQDRQQFLLLLTHKISEHIYTDTVKNWFRGLLDSNLSEESFRAAYKSAYGGTQPELCMNDVLQFGMLVASKATANLAVHFGYKLECCILAFG